MAQAKAAEASPKKKSTAEDQPELTDEQRERKKRSMREEVQRRRAALKRQEAERKLPAQLMFIIMNSLGVGVVMSLLVTVALNNLPLDSTMRGSDITRLFLFMSFTLGFLLTLLLLMRRLPPNWWQLANEFATAEKYKAPHEKWGGALKKAPSAEYAPLFDMTRKKTEAPPTLAAKDDDAPFTDSPPSIDENGTEQAQADAPVAPLPPTSAEAVAKAKADAIAEIDKFVASVSETIQAAARSADAAMKFAMQLYLAGACSATARKFLLSATDAFAMMMRTIIQAGTGKMFAESFALNVEEYAQREAYRGIIQAGNSAMDGQLNGQANAGGGMLLTLQAWSNNEQKPGLPRVVTFLFTDIVDAAALASRLGNLHAQRVIKAHDEIVREAIEKHKGTEVQHTGDGIIATFPDPSKAVGAAQAMQQKIDAHNKSAAHLSANVRIAVNAGEAVEEAGAYFGATYKMTAKVCAMGKAGQILAADVIKSFCKTSQHLFKPFGEVTIEELGKAKVVYEITWMKAGEGVEYGDIGRTAA